MQNFVFTSSLCWVHSLSKRPIRSMALVLCWTWTAKSPALAVLLVISWIDKRQLGTDDVAFSIGHEVSVVFLFLIYSKLVVVWCWHHTLSFFEKKEKPIIGMYTLIVQVMNLYISRNHMESGICTIHSPGHMLVSQLLHLKKLVGFPSSSATQGLKPFFPPFLFFELWTVLCMFQTEFAHHCQSSVKIS